MRWIKEAGIGLLLGLMLHAVWSHAAQTERSKAAEEAASSAPPPPTTGPAPQDTYGSMNGLNFAAPPWAS